MTPEAPLQGLEPVAEVQPILLPGRPRTIRAGIRLNINGRSVRLRGLRQAPTGLLRWLLILGPGLIATSAGNDAGGITTYSSAGAKYGYDLLWVMVVIIVSLCIVQEMCSRLGAATGRGLLDLIREQFGLGASLFAATTILLANAGLVVSEFLGIGAAAELLGINKYVAVPLVAALLWYVIVFGSYSWVEKILLLMTLVFFAYPVAAFMARPDWGAAAQGAFVPTLRSDSDYNFLLVGLIGTTITPFMQVFQQSSMVERGVARRHYGPERIDAYVGAIFSSLMSISMIIATAATLHVIGKTELESAADAALALEPVMGSAATTLFAIGLLGASTLAASVLPLATAYAVCEVLGVPKGVHLDLRRGRVFYGLFTALIVIGVALALIPNLPVIQLMLAIQVGNGVLLPIILVFIMLLINDERVVGPLKNSRLYNVLGWGTVVLVGTAVLVMLGGQLFQLLGFSF
jgi:NRAMP (natural resistance-associated macrophage protein)-like metal ion transporter